MAQFLSSWIWETEKFACNTRIIEVCWIRSFFWEVAYWNDQLKFEFVEHTASWPQVFLFFFVILALLCLSDSTEKPALRARCPVPPEMNCDRRFLGGLISEKNSLLGPLVEP